ncbi:MAG: hypothetical protein ACR2GA_00565 [Chloroflexota bacterium]
MPNTIPIPSGLLWLREQGLSDSELRDLGPAVPGQFTMANSFYVNSGSPGIVYFGTEEGTLPLVTGRWYLIPADISRHHPNLTRDAVAVARAVRLAR